MGRKRGAKLRAMDKNRKEGAAEQGERAVSGDALVIKANSAPTTRMARTLDPANADGW